MECCATAAVARAEGKPSNLGREVATLRALVDAGTRSMNYVYDMGDYWEHAVIIERVTASLPNVTYPQFLGGERRCPPEDCGGVPGYYEFLENIGSEDRAERKSALDWARRAV